MLPHELARGADGAMTGFSFPEMLVEVCRLMRAGEAEAAFDLYDRYLPLVRYEQQPGLGLAVRKYVLWRARRPGPRPSALAGAAEPRREVRPRRAEVDLLLARLESSQAPSGRGTSAIPASTDRSRMPRPRDVAQR